MKRHSPLSDSKGFTLIEVIIALAVLTIGVLAVNAMQTASVKGNASSQRITQATTWGTDFVEHLAALPYSAGTNGKDDDGDGLTDEADEDVFDAAQSPYALAAFANNGLDDDNDGNVDEADEGNPEDGYAIRWTVQDNTPINNARLITVFVDYPSTSGQPITFTLLKVDKI
ncbi:MAG: hypothetical protein Kow0089_02630 [Desulfobulbaceae bacterium]